MSKSKGFFSILIPSATVFFSSACIMIIELVAGRLIARHLGSSLYTWTSVIGVVLSGITIGNYLGGRIADRFAAKKALAVLFAVSSIACVVIVILNNLVGQWIFLWTLSWPMRVFSHICLVFLIPSTLLGAISPVVAKMALDSGLPTGRTVGDIYACGAAGSIAGTFLAGFYLIATMGTIAIIWTVGAALLVMAVLYWWRLWVLYIWAVIFILLLVLGMAKVSWAEETGSSVALREKPNPRVIYEDETQYCHIEVRRISEEVDKRAFMQDKLMHSTIIMDDIFDLQYFYTKIYAAITEGLSKDKEKLSVMVIGGGGYVYPRYVEKVWKGSRIDVAEIDSGVTEAAMQAFGLEKDTTINTITMDARNYVDQLLERKRNGEKIPQYDFVYEDAINDYTVPFQLVTREFDEKISAILTDDGVYMVNLLDIFDSGLFLGSVINTISETFPYVYVVTTEDIPASIRSTFVIIAAKHKLDLKNIISEYKRENLKLWYLSETEIRELNQKSGGLIITDDYAPVENLLAPVVRDSTKGILAQKYLERAQEFKRKGQFEKSIENYLLAIEVDPIVSIQSYNEIAIMCVRMGDLEQAVEAFNKAIRYNDQRERKSNIASIHYSLGVALKKLGKSEQATEQFQKAVSEFRRDLAERPTCHKTWMRLGNTFATMGDFKAAAEPFKKALALNPANPVYYDNLVKALEYSEQYDEAIEVLKKQIYLMKHYKQDEAASQLQRYLELLEFKEAKSKSL